VLAVPALARYSALAWPACRLLLFTFRPRSRIVNTRNCRRSLPCDASALPDTLCPCLRLARSPCANAACPCYLACFLACTLVLCLFGSPENWVSAEVENLVLCERLPHRLYSAPKSTEVVVLRGDPFCHSHPQLEVASQDRCALDHLALADDEACANL